MSESLVSGKITKRRRIRAFFRKLFCFVIFVGLCSAMVYNFQIIPVLIPLTQAQATTDTTVAVQEIIRSCVRGGTYSDYIHLRYGADGSVAALETDTAGVALLTGEIITETAKALGAANALTVRIPMGNLSGGALFSGRGPIMQIQIVVSPKVTCDVQHEFLESGINQTLHRIFASVQTEVWMLIPAARQKMTVTTKYCIAETVIVGKVPDAYTKIHRLSDEISESDIDDLYDFGATAD